MLSPAYAPRPPHGAAEGAQQEAPARRTRAALAGTRNIRDHSSLGLKPMSRRIEGLASPRPRRRVRACCLGIGAFGFQYSVLAPTSRVAACEHASDQALNPRLPC
eukprot:scaffold18316_cov119-Isochrysis_galbana.AAC.3